MTDLIAPYWTDSSLPRATWEYAEGPIFRPGNGGDAREVIKCYGNIPELTLLTPFSRNDYGSVLQICAAYRYGGVSGKNAGAYCFWYPLGANFIAFNTTLMGIPSEHATLQAFCRMRCFCTDNGFARSHLSDEEDGDVKKEENEDYKWEIQTPETRQLMQDLSDSRVLYAIPPNPQLHSSMDVTLMEPDRAHPERSKQIATTIYGMDENQVECPNQRLPNALNQQFSLDDPVFNTLEEACLAPQLRDHTMFSFGGFCKHPQGRSYDTPTIYFSDDYTRVAQHESEGIDRAKMLFARLYCYSRCWCKHARNKHPRPIIPWLNNAIIDDSYDGLVVTVTISRTAKPITIMPRATPRPGGRWRPCGQGQINDCPFSEPPENIDEVLRLVKNPSIKPSHAPPSILSSSSSAASCGGGCSGMIGSCKGSAGCMCAARSTAQVGVYIGLCLMIGSRHVGPRNPSSAFHDMPGCPCNKTYVSQSCCDSKTGVVWEAPDKRLGRLAIDDL